MELTWYGHSTWEVTVDGTTYLIDPFFDNPKTDVSPTELEAPDYVLLTHGHADHIADAGAFTDSAVVCGTPEIAGYVDDEHDARETVGMNIGGTAELGGVFVTMVQAYHTNGIDMEYGMDVGMPGGYVISEDMPNRTGDGTGLSFYHAGDTALMSEMRDVIGAFLEPDVAAVPIGDHFTMGPAQAAIAVDWLDVDLALPMHYDTFPPIEVDPERFVEEVDTTGSDAEVLVAQADEPIDLRQRL